MNDENYFNSYNSGAQPPKDSIPIYSSDPMKNWSVLPQVCATTGCPNKVTEGQFTITIIDSYRVLVLCAPCKAVLEKRD